MIERPSWVASRPWVDFSARPLYPQKRVCHGRMDWQSRPVELLSDWPGESYPLYALYPSRHLPAAKVRAFIDFVQSRLVRTDNEAPAERTRARTKPSSQAATNMTY